jgi:cephalosporin hydroxylase
MTATSSMSLVRRARATLERRIVLAPPVQRAITNAFGRLYYYAAEPNSDRTWRDTSWLGTPILKCPLDLWLYQELIHEYRPQLIVESGTNRGASAHFLATLCDIVGEGHVLTIDIEQFPDVPEHPRLTHRIASATAPDTVDWVNERSAGLERVMVILDSDHTAAHVREELRLYADIVPPGGYLIVEDTNVNGHPAAPEFGPGPMEALDDFLGVDNRYAIDPRGQKFLMTMNPRGLLRRHG